MADPKATSNNNMEDPKATSNDNMEDPKPTPKNNSGDIPTMTFKSAKDAIAFAKGVEEKDRYKAQKQIIEETMRYYEQNLEFAKETFKYIRDSGEYKNHVTAEEFYEWWGDIAEMAEEEENKKTTYVRNGDYSKQERGGSGQTLIMFKIG